MNRSKWLQERRREAEERYDTLWAPLYNEKWGVYPNASHQRFIREFLGRLAEPGRVLDAACGAGRYTSMLLEKGHTVLGIDQSQGMLSSARSKFPGVQLEKVGLQEMAYREAFDGAICMDAMEHISPDDWPRVLVNFHRALKPGGYLYFTVEIAPQDEVQEAFVRGQELGLPIVQGEWPDQDDVYHYYPSMQQVREWLSQAGLELLKEGEGDGYHHFVVRAVGGDSRSRIRSPKEVKWTRWIGSRRRR